MERAGVKQNRAKNPGILTQNKRAKGHVDQLKLD